MTIEPTTGEARAGQPRARKARGRGEGRKLRSSSLMLLLAMGTVGTLLASAVFQDTASTSATAFSTGTVDITTSKDSVVLYTPVNTAWAPGDTEYAPVQVRNTTGAGTKLPFWYAVTATNTEGVIAPLLNVKIYNYPVATCDAAHAATIAALTALNGAAGAGVALGNVGVTEQKLLGDRTLTSAGTGNQTLAATATQDLCFVFNLPLATTEAAGANMNVTNNATFHFYAAQVRNN
jgi:hypothetical protein